MNIGVNARLLVENNMSGIGWFIHETMQRLVAEHTEHTFYYFFDRPYAKKFITSQNIIPIVIPPKCRYHPLFYKLWYNFQLPRKLKKYKIDLFISADSINTLKSETPSILVIHDIAFEHFPHYVPWYMSKYLKRVTRLGAHKATKIATVSEYSKNDISSLYNINLDDIYVVYSGTKNNFKPIGSDQKIEIKAKYTSKCDYFLFIGTIHPRKNLKNQLLAFEMFKDLNKKSDHKFLVVGSTWIWDKELDKVFNNMKFKDDVLFIGHISTEELSKITAAATAIMYVSVFEGFGVPIMEAFQSEVPVITSNTSSMPEIAGDAALIVDPFDPGKIFDAMNDIYNNPETVKRLVESGIKRKNLFSWDNTASKFNKIFIDTISEVFPD